MKKNLAKKITMSILAGAMLMSSSVVWAASEFVTQGVGGTGSFYLGYKESSITAITGNYNFAVGSDAKIQSATNSVVIGTNAQISEASGSVALGYGSVVVKASNVVSVGDGGATDDNGNSYGPDTRSIINVTDVATAAGLSNTGKISDINAYTYGSYAVNLNTLQRALSEISSTSGSVDAYTKDEVDNKLGDYAKTTDVANTYATITKLNEKANAADVYMRNELDTKLDNYAKTTDVANTYAKTTDVANTYATITKLNEKANAVDVYTKTETDNVITSAVSGKADKATTLAGYGITDAYTKNEVDSELGKKADKATTLSGYDITDAYTKNEVDSELGKKADKATTLSGYGITDAYTKEQVNDLINGGSAAIAGINQRLEKTNAKINKVGAGAAALAALHPLDYDPDDKLTFSAGMGNYAGENAAALGAFYRPNEKFMVSLGGTMGNGENMVNLGLSIGLDKASGLAKLSKRELIQKVNAVEAENEALEDRVAKLEALVAQLAKK